MSRIAITRAISPQLGACELTCIERAPIDVGLAVTQHAAYEQALTRAGCVIVQAAPAPDMPDGVFVEDMAIVVEEVAVIALPGAMPRRREVTSVAGVLACHRPLLHMTEPATLDGGDVLVVGQVVYVGVSGRTNATAVTQLRDLLRRFGYDVRAVPVRGCLHLKSAVTLVAHDVLLLNPACVDAAALPACELIAVDPVEPHAANALRIGERVIYPSQWERTRVRLEQRGIAVDAVDVSEVIRAEGAVTCCSIVFEA